MRSADATTIIRVLLIIFVAYLIIYKFNPFVIAILIGIAILLDAIDGFFALHEASHGKINFGKYVAGLRGDPKAKAEVAAVKKTLKKKAKYGARMDVAGDRAVEYILWITFVYTGVVPIFVLFLVVIRHSFVDAVMAAKGTSSKMKTGFAKAVYSSNIGRGFVNVVKFVTFAYLPFVYISGYPIIVGYVLVTVLVAYIMLRGAAELYESFA
jgi:phosphatidylglycerophosphate synthase